MTPHCTDSAGAPADQDATGDCVGDGRHGVYRGRRQDHTGPFRVLRHPWNDLQSAFNVRNPRNPS